MVQISDINNRTIQWLCMAISHCTLKFVPILALFFNLTVTNDCRTKQTEHITTTTSSSKVVEAVVVKIVVIVVVVIIIIIIIIIIIVVVVVVVVAIVVTAVLSTSVRYLFCSSVMFASLFILWFYLVTLAERLLPPLRHRHRRYHHCHRWRYYYCHLQLLLLILARRYCCLCSVIISPIWIYFIYRASLSIYAICNTTKEWTLIHEVAGEMRELDCCNGREREREIDWTRTVWQQQTVWPIERRTNEEQTTAWQKCEWVRCEGNITQQNWTEQNRTLLSVSERANGRQQNRHRTLTRTCRWHGRLVLMRNSMRWTEHIVNT